MCEKHYVELQFEEALLLRNMETESMHDRWNTYSLLPFSAPSTILICGSTQSGKTHFTKKKLLQNANGMFSMHVDRIIYAYSEHQPMFEEMEQKIPNFSLHQGLPSKEEIEQYTRGKLSCVIPSNYNFLKTSISCCRKPSFITLYYINIYS